MEREGYVSLWLGNIPLEELLYEYVEVTYNEDGLCEESQFLKDFNINMEDFDEDFIESIFIEENTNALEEILDGCSYEETVIPELNVFVREKQIEGYNTAILLYNFHYEGEIEKVSNSICNFTYVGTVKYE